MKKFKITDAKGKVHELPGYWADAVVAAHDAVEHNDQIETAKLTAEIDGEAVELVLPKEMVMGLLSQVGAGGAGGGEEPPPADAEEEEEEAVEAAAPVDAEEEVNEEDQGKPGAFKMDEAEFDKRLDAAVEKKVNARMDALKRDAVERAEIERIAAPLVTDGYEFSKAKAWTICADALDTDEAKALAEKANKGDARAQGELLANLKFAAKAKKDAADSSEDLAGAINAGGERNDGESELSTREKARKDQNSRFGKSRGQKTETKTDAA